MIDDWNDELLLDEDLQNEMEKEFIQQKRQSDSPHAGIGKKFKSTSLDQKSSEISSSSSKEESTEPSTSSSSGNPTSKSHNSNAILVSPKQRGNPVLKSICSVPWEYDEKIIPDYLMGPSTCALFLSIRYHNLNPDYIHDRLKLLGNKYELRVLLVQVDTQEPHHALKHLTRICILTNMTLMLAWSAEEAGRILENYKIFENKPPDLIMERKGSDPHQKLVNALTSVRSINKTDAGIILATFGSLESVLKLPSNRLALCPGLGQRKAERLYNVLHQPFLREKSVTAKRQNKL